VTKIDGVCDPAKGTIKRDFLKSNERGLIKIAFQDVLFLEKFSVNPKLGNILLLTSKLIGSGNIVKIKTI
jgi:translation elongation factor EF-1alpha